MADGVNLNPAQQAAVDFTHLSPAVVTAAAGSGKTTLVNSLFKIYETGEGQVFIDGADIALCDTASVRDALAYAPQDNFLFSDTLSGNIGFCLFKRRYPRV